jgi:hypothetical protein
MAGSLRRLVAAQAALGRVQPVEPPIVFGVRVTELGLERVEVAGPLPAVDHHIAMLTGDRPEQLGAAVATGAAEELRPDAVPAYLRSNSATREGSTSYS